MTDEIRTRLLFSLKGLFRKEYEKHFLDKISYLILVEAVNSTLDHPEEELKCWDFIYINFSSEKVIYLCKKLLKYNWIF